MNFDQQVNVLQKVVEPKSDTLTNFFLFSSTLNGLENFS